MDASRRSLFFNRKRAILYSFFFQFLSLNVIILVKFIKLHLFKKNKNSSHALKIATIKSQKRGKENTRRNLKSKSKNRILKLNC
jgi:hypothetical protein